MDKKSKVPDAPDAAEYAKLIRDLGKKYDQETAHGTADHILCEILTAHGYAKVVRAFNKLDKWYA